MGSCHLPPCRAMPPHGAMPPRSKHALPTRHLTKVDSLATAWAHVGLPSEGGDTGGWKKRGRAWEVGEHLSQDTPGWGGPHTQTLQPTPSPNTVALHWLHSMAKGKAACPALPLTFAGSLGRCSIHFPLLHLHRVLDGSRSSLPLDLRLFIDVGPGTTNVHPCRGAQRGCSALGSPSSPSPLSHLPQPH